MFPALFIRLFRVLKQFHPSFPGYHLELFRDLIRGSYTYTIRSSISDCILYNGDYLLFSVLWERNHSKLIMISYTTIYTCIWLHLTTRNKMKILCQFHVKEIKSFKNYKIMINIIVTLFLALRRFEGWDLIFKFSISKFCILCNMMPLESKYIAFELWVRQGICITLFVIVEFLNL